MIELPGIGSTPPPEPGRPYLDAAVTGIEDLRSALGFEHWRILSYSSGTRVAEHYINLHPARVERAVFLCPIETTRLTAAALRTAIRLDTRFPQVGNWVLSGLRFRFLLNLLGFNLKRNPLSEAWFREITSQPVEVLKETLRSMPRGGVPHFQVPPRVPILFVWGSRDLITASPRKPAAGHMLVQAGHSAPQTAAEQVAQGILPFLSAT